MERAYERIDAMLKVLDSQIQEKGGLRTLLIIVGVALIVIAVALFFIGVFQQSHLELAGKGGAGTLLLTSGVGVLASIQSKDRKLRTLTSRIRAQLLACLAREYAEAQACMTRTLERMDEEFSSIRKKANSPEESGAIEL